MAEPDNKSPENTSSDYQLFIKLYLANERRINGYVRALVPNWSDIDDVIQETVTVMWSKFNEFQKGSNFSAWALKIAHFQVLKYYKDQKNNRLYFSQDVVEAISEKIAAQTSETDERLSILRRCLERLQAKELNLIQMRYEPGNTTQSVSRQTGQQAHVLYRLFNKIHAKLLLCMRRTLAERGTI